MKSKTHNLVEAILAALAPVFQKNPEYDTIFESMCLVMARVIQATPEKGVERRLREEATVIIGDALSKFLAMEEQYENEKRAKKEIVAQGINEFADLEPVGGHILSDQSFALQGPPIEPGSFGDYPDNPNQNIAKTVKPFNVQEAMVEEDEAFKELTKLPEGITIPEGIFGNPEVFVDPHGVFVEPSDEYTPGEGPYSQDPEIPEAPEEAAPQ